MNVLLVGSGGREHALAWRLAQSGRCAMLYCAPGNAGMEECADCVDIGAEDIDSLVAFAEKNAIDLVVVGPEAPLVAGLADRLAEKNIPVFGPSKAAAQLEGSKGFMKNLCKKYNLPTAAYETFTEFEAAKTYILAQHLPLVVKADGLAAGKGVIIAQTHDEAVEAAESMLTGGAFGDAGASIVVEEFLQGEEISYFALSDGKTVIPFGTAQDHKRAFDGDEGPNTGGMGAYSPAPIMNKDLDKKIFDTIIQPLVDGMKKDGVPFNGVIFAGLMIDGGEPRILEFNARFGDPECQVLMMQLESDFLDVIAAAAEGRLDEVKDDIHWFDGAAMCVVLAADGYPGAYEKGSVIRGIFDADMEPSTKVFHAGTAKNENGDTISNGGRVLGVTSTGKDVRKARDQVYKSISKIDWPEGFCRKDIGWRALNVKLAS